MEKEAQVGVLERILDCGRSDLYRRLLMVDRVVIKANGFMIMLRSRGT